MKKYINTARLLMLRARENDKVLGATELACHHFTTEDRAEHVKRSEIRMKAPDSTRFPTRQLLKI